MAVTNFTAFEKRLLSGSTNGRNIKVAATETAGTTLHTATAVAGEFDEVWLYAMNTSTSAVKLTVECGGVTSPDDLMEVTISPEDGEVPIMAGRIFNGGVVVAAFAATTNVINIRGYVNRMSE